ncbi:MAG: putative aminohydrolase SsnA [Chloroflexota bacterium]|nr:MAG: putative aminohydrolase SsnA [Chloroflexota bacterium]
MLITNGTIVTLGRENKIIPNSAIYIEGDKIADIGTTESLVSSHPVSPRLDARGKIVMPGNICAHTHFYGAFARGMSLPPGPPPKNFPEILQKLWWRIDRALTLEDSKYSALVCLVDAIRHGTTTLIDHHASPNAIDGSLDAIAEAVNEAGLRACLCYEVTDRNGEEGAQAGIRENVRFLKKTGKQVDRETGGAVRGTFGLHASFTVSDKTLEKCLTELDGLDAGFHVHVAEDISDEDDATQNFGMRVGERLNARGILGAKTIAAHCVHVDVGEIDLFKRTSTKVSHQPRSNMNNAVGVANVLGMLRHGVTVGLGNDGFSNNMFSEMKTAYLLHKSHQRDPRVMGADTVLEMAYANNAKICANFWNASIGELSIGAYADIILLDYAPFTEMSAGNFPWHVIFGVDGSNVTDTICGGKLLMHNRVLLTLDEEAITAKAMELSKQVWLRTKELGD